MEWYERAACRDRDPELFFPRETAGPEFEAQVEAARAICGVCDVRQECLAFALSFGETGVWGGTTDADRKRLYVSRAQREDLRRIAAGT